MAKILPPTSFDFNKPETWLEWKKRFARYRSASKLNEESQERQVDTLIYVMGQEAENAFGQLNLTNEERKDYDKVEQGFDSYFQPKTNTIHERCKFGQRVQIEGEPSEAYIRALHVMAERCDYGHNKDTYIRDRIVSGILDKDLSRELQMEESLTLATATNKVRTKELILAQQREENQVAPRTEVIYVKYKDSKRSAGANVYLRGKSGPQPRGLRGAPSRSSWHQYASQNCRYCGTSHKPRMCPAYGKTCNLCGKRNHFSKVCKSKQVNEVSKTYWINILTQNDSKDWIIALTMPNERDARFKVDTGAQCNVIPLDMYRQMKGETTKLKPSSVKLTSYSGHHIEVVGMDQLDVTHRGQKHCLPFQVVKGNVSPLLGLVSSELMGFVVRADEVKEKTLKEEYADVFEGTGKLSMKHTIRLKEGTQPTICAPRQVPHAVREKLKEELDRLEAEHIIAKVEEPTEWVNPIVNVLKPNKQLRICLDPQKLNEAIMREHYALAVAADIFARISGAKVYSTLDATAGFTRLS